MQFINIETHHVCNDAKNKLVNFARKRWTHLYIFIQGMKKIFEKGKENGQSMELTKGNNLLPHFIDAKIYYIKQYDKNKLTLNFWRISNSTFANEELSPAK